MFSVKVAILTLVLIPTIASAQRRTRGEYRADWDKIGSSGGPQLSARDMESVSPIKLLVEKRKDLKLSDDLTKQLKDLESKDKEKNQGLFKSLDSLRGVIRSISGNKTDEDRARVTIARQELRAVVGSILANYDTTLTGAMPMLDESQRKTASALLEKHREEAQEMIREKLGGRAG